MIDLTELKSRCEDLWLLTRQVWYVPFFWSLAWFSYWIFYDVIVLNQPLTQGNPLNHLGAAISITALLIAGCISAKSKKETVIAKRGGAVINPIKELLFHKILGKKNDQRQPLLQKPAQKTTMERLEQRKSQILKPEKKSQSLFKTSQVQKLPETPQKPAQIPTSPRAFSSQIKQPVQTQKSREIPSECLVCPNLLSCNHRKSRPIESKSPCPYTKK